MVSVLIDLARQSLMMWLLLQRYEQTIKTVCGSLGKLLN